MAGKNRIWRIGDNETDGSITNINNEIIEFDENTVSQGFRDQRLRIDVDISETNALKGDINPSQDGGVGSVRYVINGIVKGGSAPTARKTLIKWLLNDKFTANFPHGRFGTVFTEFPELDIEPSGNADTGYGWLIEDIEIQKDNEYKNKTAFIMTLKYNGRKTGITDNLA